MLTTSVTIGPVGTFSASSGTKSARVLVPPVSLGLVMFVRVLRLNLLGACDSPPLIAQDVKSVRTVLLLGRTFSIDLTLALCRTGLTTVCSLLCAGNRWPTAWATILWLRLLLRP